jgi:hypothetical protein
MDEQLNEPTPEPSLDDKPKRQRPTIAQLEDILERDDEVAITILPNGEVQVQAGADIGDRKPLTFRENLGGEYKLRRPTIKELLELDHSDMGSPMLNEDK